ncbi:MAG: NFACT family protein, partial [Oscillospiraceae bacterium]
MALDGMCLSLLTEETKKLILGSRVEKINQPSRDELVFSMRGEQGSYKLLISAKAEMARAQITALPPENPKQAPMLCMLLRKLIGSGRLIAIRQNGFERVLFFDFRTVNEFGDEVTYTLISEIMGRYSNIILTDGGGKIIESIKRVGLDKSSVRQILPGLTYVLPPSQDKIPLGENYNEAAERICNFPRDIVLYKAIGEVLEGVSPILTREISYRALKGCDGIISALTLEDKENLKSELKKLNETVKSQHTAPTMVFREDGSPLDFSFIDICQYEGVSQKKNFGSLWELLDGFYGTRDEAERMKQKMADFSRNVTSKIERIEKKLALQRNELLECENKDDLKLKGDLLSSYMHTLKRGMTETEIVNFYDP